MTIKTETTALTRADSAMMVETKVTRASGRTKNAVVAKNSARNAIEALSP